MLVGYVRHQRQLPAEIDGAVADALQDVADRQEPQVRRQQVHQRDQGNQHAADRRRGLDQVAAAIQGLAQDQIGQQTADRTDQLQQTYVGVTCLEAIDQDQRVERRGHERPEAPDDPAHDQVAVGRVFGEQTQ
jgi:hypothetical protein